jgi:hypothetical protein
VRHLDSAAELALEQGSGPQAQVARLAPGRVAWRQYPLDQDLKVSTKAVCVGRPGVMPLESSPLVTPPAVEYTYRRIDRHDILLAWRPLLSLSVYCE